jgi:hypothetical protein
MSALPLMADILSVCHRWSEQGQVVALTISAPLVEPPTSAFTPEELCGVKGPSREPFRFERESKVSGSTNLSGLYCLSTCGAL